MANDDTRKAAQTKKRHPMGQTLVLPQDPPTAPEVTRTQVLPNAPEVTRTQVLPDTANIAWASAPARSQVVPLTLRADEPELLETGATLEVSPEPQLELDAPSIEEPEEPTEDDEAELNALAEELEGLQGEMENVEGELGELLERLPMS
jgi:hypothetical protein